MSHDDSTTPEPDIAEDRRATGSGGLAGNKMLLGGVALLLVIGLIAFFALKGGGDDNEASDCVKDTVRLTTTPALKDVIATAVKAVEKDESCMEFKVTEGTVKDVIALLNDPNAEMPELWIPDSPTWQGQLAAAGWSGQTIVESIAQTPVALVSGPSAKAPASWAEALSSGRVAMSDPSADGASALALLAPYAERKQTGIDEATIKQSAVPVAQSYGERAVAGTTSTTDLAEISAVSNKLVPVTEQAYLAARRGNDLLTIVTPKTGVPMLNFPILGVTRGGGDVFGNSGSDRAARAGRALSHWFSSGAGQAAVSEAEFRLPGAEQLEGGIGFGQAKVLGGVNQQTTDSVLRDWRVLSVPSSMLVLFDLSGSMKQPLAASGASRVQVAVDAAKTALPALPDHARVGIWGFSKNRGQDDESWEEIVPMLPLDQNAANGQPQREFLDAEAGRMAGRVRGATAVFDTLLAAYQQALDNWDPAYFNSVVVFTDGASDDTSSVTLDKTLADLQGMRDPAKPVRVVVIGLSPDADTPELGQIANATGGKSYIVNKPEDMLGVLAQALLDR